MDIQTRKIVFIQEILKLQNEDLLLRLEHLLRSEKTDKCNNFEPMSTDEFYKRIEQSMKDSDEEKLTNSKDLIAEIEEWT